MDENDVFFALAAFSSAILLARSIRSRARGWIAISALVLVVSGAGRLFFEQSAGYVGAGLWAVFVLLPLGGQRWLGRLSDQQRYRAASRLASALRWLHPADGWWDRPRLFEALDLGRRGEVDDAAALLEQLERGSSIFAREARVHRLRMQSRWEDVLAWLTENVPHAAAAESVSLLPMRLRALGETGDVEGLCALYEEAEPLFDRSDLSSLRSVCRLFVLAFAGRSERVAALYDGPLRSSPKAIRSFWIATAELAADPEDTRARARLRALLDEAEPSLRPSVERRSSHPPAKASAILSARALAVVARIERERDHEERYGERPGTLRGSVATLALMVPSVSMFVVEELSGGSTTEATLRALGAVSPETVLAGELWRLVAATTLHYGFLHLAMNMLGLWVLGRYVEHALGRARYVGLYLATGVASMAGVVLLSRAGLVEPQLLVGASGGVMGLVGATGAVMLRGLRSEGSALARRRLLGVASIVGAQTIFDLLTPEVSFLSHFGGALLGFVLASLLRHRVTPAAAK
jgi:rhomboid protease GluP